MDSLGSASVRLLAEEGDDPPPEKWELIFMSIVMVFMFAALITDRVAPDHVFVIAVTFCMVTGIITISEGLKGFANEGVLTVMVRKMSVTSSASVARLLFIATVGAIRCRYRSGTALPAK
jgi:hypothetical protein